jgi:thiol-disulfide isomerase/thioredoxin
MNIRSKLVATVLATAWLLGFAVSSYADDEKTAQAQPVLADAQRAAPNFVGTSNWLNSGPLSITDLRGKVVLVDFWTYGCINCTRTLPYVARLYDTYKDRGLVVVGIHTPGSLLRR